MVTADPSGSVTLCAAVADRVAAVADRVAAVFMVVVLRTLNTEDQKHESSN